MSPLTGLSGKLKSSRTLRSFLTQQAPITGLFTSRWLPLFFFFLNLYLGLSNCTCVMRMNPKLSTWMFKKHHGISMNDYYMFVADQNELPTWSLLQINSNCFHKSLFHWQGAYMRYIWKKYWQLSNFMSFKKFSVGVPCYVKLFQGTALIDASIYQTSGNIHIFKSIDFGAIIV